MRKFTRNKYGLTENPIGAQVTFEYQRRTLLGDVKGIKIDPVTNAITLIVRHFNGEPWPIEPLAVLVNVLERKS